MGLLKNYQKLKSVMIMHMGILYKFIREFCCRPLVQKLLPRNPECSNPWATKRSGGDPGAAGTRSERLTAGPMHGCSRMKSLGFADEELRRQTWWVRPTALPCALSGPDGAPSRDLSQLSFYRKDQGEIRTSHRTSSTIWELTCDQNNTVQG